MEDILTDITLGAIILEMGIPEEDTPEKVIQTMEDLRQRLSL